MRCRMMSRKDLLGVLVYNVCLKSMRNSVRYMMIGCANMNTVMAVVLRHKHIMSSQG